MDEPLDWLDSNFNVGYLDALRERIRNLDAIELKNIEPEVQAAIDGVDAVRSLALSIILVPTRLWLSGSSVCYFLRRSLSEEVPAPPGSLP